MSEKIDNKDIPDCCGSCEDSDIDRDYGGYMCDLTLQSVDIFYICDNFKRNDEYNRT